MCEMYLPPYGAAAAHSSISSSVDGEERGRIDQRRADAERAGRHLVADEAAHRVHLGGRRRAVVLADRVDAECRRADVRGDVLRDPVLLGVREVSGKRGPGDIDAMSPPACSSACAAACRASAVPSSCLRRRSASVTPCFRSLSERGSCRMLIVGVAEHVDEARRDRHAGGIDLHPGARVFQPADRRDRFAVDGDICRQMDRCRCRRRRSRCG